MDGAFCRREACLLNMDRQRRFEYSSGGIPRLYDYRVRSSRKRHRSIERTGIDREFGDVVHINPHCRDGICRFGSSNKMDR